MIPNQIISRANRAFRLDASLIGDLWFFEAAARLNSFSAAAQELSVTQGAVSQRIRHLEDRLGAKLFIRLGRGVTLTVDGETLYRTASHAFHNIEAGASFIVGERRQKGLVVSCAPSLAMEWLLPRLSAWYRVAEGTKIQIRAEFHPVNREIFINEGIEIAIRYDHVDYGDLGAIDLYQERLFPVCTPSYWDANGRFQKHADLARLTLLHDASPWVGAAQSTEWRTWCTGVGASDVNRMQSEHFNLAQMAVRAALLDQGIAMGRSLLVADYLRDGRLIRPFGKTTVRGAKYRFLTAGSVKSTSLLARLASWMKKEMELAASGVA